MSSVHTTQVKTQQSSAILDFCLRKTRSGKPHDYRDKSDYIISKYYFQNVFRAEEKEKPALLNSSSLKGDFENLRFREWLIRGNKATFSNF